MLSIDNRENTALNNSWLPHFFMCVLVLFLSMGAVAKSSDTANGFYSQYAAKGSSIELVEAMEQFLASYKFRQSDEDYFRVLSLLFSNYLGAKQFERSVSLLNENRQAIKTIDKVTLRNTILFKAGKLEYKLGRLGNAEDFLLTALKSSSKDSEFIALVKNELALVYIADEQLSRAALQFEQAYSALDGSNNIDLKIKIGLNRIRVAQKLQSYEAVPGYLQDVNSLLSASNSADSTDDWLNLARQYQVLSKKLAAGAEYRLKAYRIYSDLLTKSQDPVVLSYIYGYLGELYEDEQRIKEALTFSRQALFQSQSIPVEELTYQWQWQIGRLHKKLGDKGKALDNLRGSVKTLSNIRSVVTLDKNVDFLTQVRPVYYQLAEVLLDASSEAKLESASQAYLQEVIDTLELMKLAEVENYFDSECVVLPQHRVNLTDVNDQVAVLYPVILSNRLELILQTQNQIQRYTVNVKARQLSDEILNFRTRIESYRNDETYKSPAQNLYKWLIAPVEPMLDKLNIETLVFIPDGSLRTIPIAALYDGEQFLIQRYAVATTPGASLMDPKPLRRENVTVLANGLIESVQGYSSLPSVKKEILEIAKVFPTELHLDNQFKLNESVQQMSAGEYSIVHFATHGEFSRDHTKSFLLTYDNKLTMNRLENSISLRRYSSEPLELLVLSACQTAVGDDQAALGLAGVALKAGARSALATLWFINDESTTELITRFYKKLNEENLSKAKALQLAQVDLITNTRYKHPSLWAPFLMIGNWM